MILTGVLSYLAGLFLGPYVAFFPLSLCSALLFLALIFTLLEHGQALSRTNGLLWFVLIILGVGHAYGASLSPDHLGSVAAMKEHPVTVAGTIAAPVRYTPDGFVLIVEADDVIHEGQSRLWMGRIRVVWREPDAAPVYGDAVRFTGILREPSGTKNPGGFDYGRYLKRKGIQAVVTVTGAGAMVIDASKTSGMIPLLLGQVDRWRKAIHDAALASLSNPALGLFLGMVLGEQSFIDQDVRDAFMTSGTVHILSISGSHLGLLALVVFALVQGVTRQLPGRWLEQLTLRMTATRLAVLVMLLVVSWYALLAGAEMATIRSWIMIAVFGLGVWFGRERNMATALAVAALLIVIPHPEAVYDISFQLSYLSVAAMAVVLRNLSAEQDDPLSADRTVRSSGDSRWQTVRHHILLTLKLSLAVSLATLPLVAWYFYQIAWLGMVANLVVVPLAGILVIPLGLFSAVSLLLMGWAALPFSALNQGVLDVLLQAVVWMAEVPGAEWHVASPGILPIMVFWATLLLTYAGWHLLWVRWSGVALLAGLVCWWGWSPRSGWEWGQLRVTYFDVGQGDAALVELPDGQTVLIDSGPVFPRLDMGRAVIGPYLWNRGITGLDHVIATHPQWDHVGGLAWVIRTFPVRHVWTNGIRRPEEFFRRLESSMQQVGVRPSVAKEGQELLRSDLCSLTVLNPALTSPDSVTDFTTSPSGTWLNNQSLVTQLVCGRHSFLFTADVEREGLERLARQWGRIQARVVSVPHHGAKSSLNQNWIDRVQTEFLVVSVGAHNRYGHPSPEVLHAYGQKGIQLYRTDRDGAIWFTASLEGQELERYTAREQELVPVRFGKGGWEEEVRNWKRAWDR